jgi:hypothetical protein
MNMEEEAKRRQSPAARFLFGLLIGIAIGLGIMFFAQPMRPVGRVLAQRASCKANLSAIGKGIAICQSDHHEQSPAELGLVFGDGRCAVFLCPSVPRQKQPDWPKEPNQLREAVNRETDYIYVPLSGSAEAELLTAFDIPANHQQEIVNALYSDLHVGDFSHPDDFMAAVQRTNDALSAERGLRR